MKHLSIALLVAVSMAVAAAAQAPKTASRVRGRVTAAATGRPVQGAIVRLVKLGDVPVTREATTDANGGYDIAGLPGATYAFYAMHPHYLELNFDQPQPLARYRMLALEDGEHLDEMDFKLHRGGAITGSITDEYGEPFAGVQVGVLRELIGGPLGRRFMPSGGANVRHTDDRGRFRVYGLQPGAYVVLATPTPTGDAVPDIGRTYYPGTMNASEAQVVRVDLGQDAVADFSMIPAKHVRIAGVVRDSQGRPVSGARIALITPRGVQFDTLVTSRIDTEGRFGLENVPPGDHVLQVRPPAADPQLGPSPTEWAVVPVTVAGSDITDLMVTTGAGFVMSGRVTFETSSIRPSYKGLRVHINPVDRSIRWMMPSSPPDSGLVDPEGRFSIIGLAGRVHVVPGSALPTGWFFKRVLLKGSDVTLSGIDVKGDVEGVELVLTNRATTVTGTVRDAQGAQLNDYIVAFLPVGQFDERDRGRRQRTIRPDPDGVFRIRNLPPGDYVAAAVPVLSLPMGAEWDPVFFEKIRPGATGLKLTEGQTIALNLKMLE